MAEIGPVVVVCFLEWQIYYVIHDIGQAYGQYQQTLVNLFIPGTHVDSQSHTVKNTNCDVSTCHKIRFEFVLKLAILGRIQTLKTNQRKQTKNYGQNSRNCAQDIVVCILRGGILKVQGGREADIEAVEDQQGDKHFLEQNKANPLQTHDLRTNSQYKQGEYKLGN